MDSFRFRRLFRLPTSRGRIAGDVDDELRFHLESRIQDLVARGTSPDDARRLALGEFGDVQASRAELVTVDTRIRARERRADLLDVLRQDLAYAFRGLRREPGTAITIAITLALAIGANAAIFSFIDPLLFRPPLGVANPASTRRLYTNHPNAPSAAHGRRVGSRFSYPEFEALHSGLDGIARVAAYRQWDSSSVRVGSDSLFTNVTYATAGFLPLLGAHLGRGRTYTLAEDDVVNPEPVAVISASFARRVFGDADPLGRNVVVRDERYTVIGVVADFEGIDYSAVDLWLPLSTEPHFGEPNPARPWYRSGDTYLPLVARLEPGISDRTFEARASSAYQHAYTGSSKGEIGRAVIAGSIISARGPIARQREISIGIRLAVVAGIVLLIACANVANLLLARALRRRREIAVRLALGISRFRLAFQLLTESVVLAAIGIAGASLMAIWLGGALRVALLPRIDWIEPPLGFRVLVFATGCTVVAALLAGLGPAMLATRSSVAEALQGVQHGGVAHRSRTRATLLAFQAGLSVVLVSCAALFVESLQNVKAVDIGVDANRLIIASASFLDGRRHPERATILSDLAIRIGSMPGVARTTLATGAPLFQWFSGVALYESGRDSALSNDGRTEYLAVRPEYFDVAGTHLIAGRAFSSADRRGTEPVMVISRTMSRTFWPHENPTGRCISLEVASAPCYTIVGIAQDVHSFGVAEEPNVHFYLPIDQQPYDPNVVLIRISSSAESHAIAAKVREEFRRSLPNATLSVRVAADIVAPQFRPWRLGAQLFTALGLLALVVAAIGVYSVVAFAVRQRAHEIGVRIALGAQTIDLFRVVLGQGAAISAIGVALGIVVTLGAGRFVASLLYGVSPRDPVALGVAALTLMVVAMAASIGPAIRASRVNPMDVLREE